MAQRSNGAKYSFGLKGVRIRAKNDDLSTPAYNNVIGGAGPFDFSSVTATKTAVPIYFKVNSGAVVSETFDLTAAVSLSAVTVDELVTALTAASVTGWTFSKDTTGRIKMVNATTGADVQVYGTGARLMMIGQGKGVKWIKSDTFQSFKTTPTVKADETKTVTDANNLDTDIIIEGYTKGWTGTGVDTAEDWEMRELIESGTLSTDGLSYTKPITSTKKVVIEIETYNAVYTSGANLEDQLVKWKKETFLMAKGSVGEENKEGEFSTITYDFTGTNYKPKVTGAVETAGSTIQYLNVEDWSLDHMFAV